MARKASPRTQHAPRLAGSTDRPAGRVKVQVSLTPELARRLKAAAGWRGLDVSVVVAAALVAELKGFAVHVRGQGATDGPQEAPEGDDEAGGEPEPIRLGA